MVSDGAIAGVAIVPSDRCGIRRVMLIEIEVQFYAGGGVFAAGEFVTDPDGEGGTGGR